MSCEEVQARLSEYLEQSLDAATMKSVESHLSSCPVCRAEADGLALCIQRVANLPLIEPPIGFTQRVMAHVRDMEKQPSFWEGVLFPLKIKIPRQATALVLIGILAVYLFEKEEPDRELSPTSEPVTALSSNEPEQIGVAAPEPQEAPASKTLATAELKAPAQAQTKAATATPAAVATDMAKPPIGESRESGSPSLSTLEPRARAGGVISGMPVVNPGTAQPRIGAAPFPTPGEMKAAPLGSRSELIEPIADYELVVRRRPTEQGQTRRDNLSPLRKQAEKAVGERPTAPGTVDRLLAPIPESPRPQTVWVTVPQSQYEQFRKDLLAAATIESESPLFAPPKEADSSADRELRVKLTILPATEPDRANPPSPSKR